MFNCVNTLQPAVCEDGSKYLGPIGIEMVVRDIDASQRPVDLHFIRHKYRAWYAQVCERKGQEHAACDQLGRWVLRKRQHEQGNQPTIQQQLSQEFERRWMSSRLT